jgi:cell division protease FtsH
MALALRAFCPDLLEPGIAARNGAQTIRIEPPVRLRSGPADSTSSDPRERSGPRRAVRGGNLKQKGRTLLIWVALVVVFLALFNLSGSEKRFGVDYETFLADVEAGRVVAVRVHGNEIAFDLYDGTRYQTLGLVDEDLTQALSHRGVTLRWGEAKRGPLRTALLIGVPVVLVVALFVLLLKRAQGGTPNILSMRKSRARLVSEKSSVTFADVGGCEEAKAQLGDVIDFLKHPERWTGAGVRLPRGVLLEGPPGCGKTLLARAVAGETDAKFYLVSASEFVEMFVGVGAARVRDMFEIAAKEAPAVVFIDELDAVGRRRGSGIGAGHDEREQTLNQLLVCMDGFETNDRVVVIGATNRSDVLDAALLRSGRFDRRVRIPALTRDERVEVLRIHTRPMKLGEEVSLEDLAERTAGRSGADLESLVNEAGLLAVRRARSDAGEPLVRRDDFERALAPDTAGRLRFDQVDAALIESTTQLSQPTGCARVRLTLREGRQLEGDLVWADAAFVKVHLGEDGAHAIVPKFQIEKLEALDGTDPAEVGDVTPDPWARKLPGLA